ncbi:MAG: hypothetical protein AAGK04_07130 [Planctomycetota bacterium]
MRLTDIVQHADLDLWPQLALVFFVLAFAMMLVRVVLTSKAKDRAIAHIVLEDDIPAPSDKEPRHG